MVTQDDPARYLTLQFLAWIAETPRTYGEVIDAWRTSCPRLPIWEDAIANGFVRRGSGATLRDAKVTITASGKELLKATHIPPSATPIARKSTAAN